MKLLSSGKSMIAALLCGGSVYAPVDQKKIAIAVCGAANGWQELYTTGSAVTPQAVKEAKAQCTKPQVEKAVQDAVRSKASGSKADISPNRKENVDDAVAQASKGGTLDLSNPAVVSILTAGGVGLACLAERALEFGVTTLTGGDLEDNIHLELPEDVAVESDMTYHHECHDW